MNRTTIQTKRSANDARTWSWGFIRPAAALLLISTLSGFPVVAAAQAPADRTPRHGEITGNDVYIRSGPSMNHYPVAKLMAGDRVTVIGESGEWYEIRPPASVFSYISGDYVDTPDNRNGVVNGDNVRVRAGSTLEDFADLKYVVQTTLPKGAEVTILGRDPDGFLRIKPPDEVTVWVSRTYVTLTSPAAPASADQGQSSGERPDGSEQPDGDSGAPSSAESPKKAADAENAQTNGDVRSSSRPMAESTAAPMGSTLKSLPETEQRRQLIELDGLANDEIQKPLEERNYKPLIERYETIAKQNDDEFARLYSQVRMQQLTYLANLRDTVQRLRRLGSQAETKRRDYLQDRARIRETLPPIPTGLDAQGELRVSALYPPGSGLRRYRLVDTGSANERTIGYVEIPPDSTIDVGQFLGRYVGLRAAAKRLQTGGVNPVPIFVLGELVPLQPEAPGESQEPDQSEGD